MKKKKPRLPVGAEYPVLKEGPLSKVGGMHRMWRQRYCVIRGGFLEYYVDKAAWTERRDPKGSVPLFFGKLESLTENISGRQFAFSIRLAERAYMFVCANQQDENSWCDAISAEITRIQQENLEYALGEEPLVVEITPQNSSADDDDRFTTWLATHVQTKKEATSLLRGLVKQLHKMSNSDLVQRCSCSCACCSTEKSAKIPEDFNYGQLTDELLKLIDPKNQPKIIERGKGMTHSTSSAEVFTEEGWLAKKKKVLQEGKFFDLLKMVTRGNSSTTTATEERSRRQKIEYHEIVPGQLKIGNTLGSGATGIVYEGTYFDQAVAVKKLHPHIAAELSAIEEFIQEAEIWKPLTFRNVLQLYGVCADPGNVCMVMEIGAMSLSDLLYKEVQYPDLSWSRRLNIARDVASGCLYLHSKGAFSISMK